MNAKGTLLIIGGAEHKGEESLDMETKNIKFKHYEILKDLLAASTQPIEIITSGSKVPHLVRKSYERAFKRMHYARPHFLLIKHRSETRDHNYLNRIRDAGAVFFTGGDQSRLADILRDTPIVKLIKSRYFQDPNFILAGTSAGAMALSDIMIKEGGNSEAILYKDLKLGKGLDILSNIIIDTHFIKRCRFGRLASAIAMHDTHLGIGLGEDTALIIKNGKYAKCRGSGMVVIIDGHNIKNSNVNRVKKGEPIFVENLRVHLLVKGSKFSLKTRNFI